MPCLESCHSRGISRSHIDDHQLSSQQSHLSPQASLSSIPSLTLRSLEKHPPNLNTQFHCLTTLKGHRSYISSLIVSGKLLYSGSSDKEIRSWKRDTLISDLYHREHEDISDNVVAIGKGAAKSLVVSTEKLFSAHQDYKIRVWKISNHEDDRQKYARLATLPTLSDRATKFLFPKNYVRIRRHKTSTWVHHVDTVSALALSKDETLLYSVSWDRTLKIWQTSNFKCLESIPNAHEDAINAVVASSDGCVYTGSADRKIKAWKKIAGEKKHSLVATLEKHNSGINALALGSNGSVLYSGSCDRSILVWETEYDHQNDQMMVVGALRGHTKSILCLAVASDLICSGSADKTIRVWRGLGRKYSCLAVLEGHQGPVKCLSASFDQDNSSEKSQLSSSSSSSSPFLIYSGGLDCDIRVWQVSVPLL